MIGVLTCGFFSKWYLVSGAFEAGRWEFAIALLVSSLINTVFFVSSSMRTLGSFQK